MQVHHILKIPPPASSPIAWREPLCWNHHPALVKDLRTKRNVAGAQERSHCEHSRPPSLIGAWRTSASKKKKWKVRPKQRKSTSFSKARKEPSYKQEDGQNEGRLWVLSILFFLLVISGKTRFILVEWWCQPVNVSSYKLPSSFLH